MTKILIDLTEDASMIRISDASLYIYTITIVLVLLSICFGFWLFTRKQSEITEYSIRPKSHNLNRRDDLAVRQP
jgi:hypothetical protein